MTLFIEAVKPGEIFVIFILIILIIVIVRIIKGDKYKDEIYLKSGSIIKGRIIEQAPGVSIKIQTKDKNFLVFKNEEIEKIIPKK
ncbi:MAG TPA: hypothetical protein VK806_02580 [Bacteroidia bacterium]|jgi:hypothetical protein|nr:hypothetical protein [Bacteroidia bacterium]